MTEMFVILNFFKKKYCSGKRLCTEAMSPFPCRPSCAYHGGIRFRPIWYFDKDALGDSYTSTYYHTLDLKWYHVQWTLCMCACMCVCVCVCLSVKVCKGETDIPYRLKPKLRAWTCARTCGSVCRCVVWWRWQWSPPISLGRPEHRVTDNSLPENTVTSWFCTSNSPAGNATFSLSLQYSMLGLFDASLHAILFHCVRLYCGCAF